MQSQKGVQRKIYTSDFHGEPANRATTWNAGTLASAKKIPVAKGMNLLYFRKPDITEGSEV